MAKCPNCDREGCDLTAASNARDAAYYAWFEWQGGPERAAGYAKFDAAVTAQAQMQAACKANAVNWRERALAAEPIVANVRQWLAECRGEVPPSGRFWPDQLCESSVEACLKVEAKADHP